MATKSRVRLSRRRFMAQGALTATAALAAPYVHGATAGGKLQIGLWDHWVPTANEPVAKLAEKLPWASTGAASDTPLIVRITESAVGKVEPEAM